MRQGSVHCNLRPQIHTYKEYRIDRIKNDNIINREEKQSAIPSLLSSRSDAVRTCQPGRNSIINTLISL